MVRANVRGRARVVETSGLEEASFPGVCRAEDPMRAFKTTSATARANEREMPHIVEMEVPQRGFAHDERKAIEEFHRSRKIRARFGRHSRRDGKEYCRWCFAEADQADLFHGTFGGTRLPLSAGEKSIVAAEACGNQRKPKAN